MDEKCVPKKIKLLISIVDRGKGENLQKMLNEYDVKYNLIALGRGTAKSEILDYLGLGQTDKDIVLSIIHEDNVGNIIKKLEEKMKEPGNGIAFTIPVSSIDSAYTLDYICSLLNKKE